MSRIFCFLGIAAFGWHRQRTRGHPPAADFGAKISKKPNFWTPLGRTSAPGAHADVHQGDAAATVLARGSAETERRIVPDGLSCCTCAHLGRFAGWFLHISSPPPAPHARPPPRNDRSAVPGGGVPRVFWLKSGYSWIQTLVPRSAYPLGRLLDKKYFSPKQTCHRVVRAQKYVKNFLFSGYCSIWMAPSAHARTPPCGQLWSQNVQKNPTSGRRGEGFPSRRAR